MGTLLLVPAAAYAQATPTTAPDSSGPGATPNQQGTVDTAGNAGGGSDAASGGDVVVTGSRIARPNLVAANPITSVQGEEFFQSGQVSIGDQLNQLPQLASTFSQSNSTRFLGTSGLNLLDLRGLGTQRTLVLVNGTTIRSGITGGCRCAATIRMSSSVTIIPIRRAPIT